MKSLRSKSKILVEQILNENFLNANETLQTLINEAEENREEEVDQTLGSDEDLEGNTGNDSEETINTDGIDEPSNGSPNLGDSLDQSVEDSDSEDQSVDEGEMTEMSNDIVKINCEINQKVISMLFDKIANLKTILNAKDIDHDTREYIALETKLSYYGDKLETLQSNANPAIEQDKVEERLNIIEAALKSLEAEIGGSNEVTDVKSSADLDEAEAEGEEPEEPEEPEEGGTEEGGTEEGGTEEGGSEGGSEEGGTEEGGTEGSDEETEEEPLEEK